MVLIEALITLNSLINTENKIIKVILNEVKNLADSTYFQTLCKPLDPTLRLRMTLFIAQVLFLIPVGLWGLWG